MAERDVAFLNAGRDARRNDERMIDERCELAARPAGPGDGDHAAGACGLNPFEHIRRIAARADADGDVALLAVREDLPGEEFIVPVVVGDAGDGGDIGGQRDGRERRPFPLIAADEFRRDMRGVGGAAAVAEQQNFMSCAKGGDEELRDRGNAVGVFARELLLDGRAIGEGFEDKVFHQSAILGKRGEPVKPGLSEVTPSVVVPVNPA